MKITRYKKQGTNKIQISKYKFKFVWNFEFGYWDLFVSCILFLGIFSLPVFAQESISIELIHEILAQEEILSAEDRSRLKEFSQQLKPGDISLEDSRAIVMAVRHKARRDEKNLSSLAYNLTKLLNNGYAQKIGKLRRREIKDIDAMMEKYTPAINSLIAQGDLDEEKLDKEDLIMIIGRDISFFIAESGPGAGHIIWQKIRSKFKEAYGHWNAHYQQLESTHQEPDNISETYGLNPQKRFFEKPLTSTQDTTYQRSRYEIEQLNFLEDFTRAQAILRRLASADSGEF